MTQKFFVGCRLPDMNKIVLAASKRKGGWSPYNDMKTLYESMIRADIKKAKLRKISGPVVVSLHWVEPNKRKDLDNVRCGLKFILDALVSLEILCTDRQSQVVGFRDTFGIDKALPGVWVTLEEQS